MTRYACLQQYGIRGLLLPEQKGHLCAITLSVLGGNSAAARRTSDLLTDMINGMLGISIDDPKGVLGELASGKGDLTAVVKAAELVSGVKVGGDATTVILQIFPQIFPRTTNRATMSSRPNASISHGLDAQCSIKRQSPCTCHTNPNHFNV